jgi:hypothetical protein
MNSPCDTGRTAPALPFVRTPPHCCLLPDDLRHSGALEDQSRAFYLSGEDNAELDLQLLFGEDGAVLVNALRTTHPSPTAERRDQAESSQIHPETGCHFGQDRHFQQTQGLWMTLDASGFAANDTNLRRYVSNDPSTSQGEQAS